MPEFVLRDFIYENYKNDLGEVESLAKYYYRRRWIKVQLFITEELFCDDTRRSFKERDYGNKNPYNIPNDKQRIEYQREILPIKGVINPIIVKKQSTGYELIEGWHRTMVGLTLWSDGYNQPTWVLLNRIKSVIIP